MSVKSSMPASSKTTEEASPFQLSAIDQSIRNLTDDQFELYTWETLKETIASNNLQILCRKPSDLRRYIVWTRSIKAQYGTIPNYIIQRRLRWDLLPESTAQTGPLFDVRNARDPFADERDFKILPNDWPYGMEDGVRHLVVWLKGKLDVEPERGDLVPEARVMVEEFVRRKFRVRVDALEREEAAEKRERVMWFRNWTALQSVPGLEHVHVLVRDVPEEVVREWTGGEEAVQGLEE